MCEMMMCAERWMDLKLYGGLQSASAMHKEAGRLGVWESGNHKELEVGSNQLELWLPGRGESLNFGRGLGLVGGLPRLGPKLRAA